MRTELKLVLFVCLTALTSAEGNGPKGKSLLTLQKYDGPESKNFFGLFRPPSINLVSSGIIPCTSSLGLMGDCISGLDCSLRNGTNGGSCASGFGACCVAIGNCSASTSQNNSYFVNPGFPGPCGVAGNGMCSFQIMKMNPSVEQYKLVFEDFDIMGPNMGNCKNDSFLVIGANTPVPIICGKNGGMEAYLDVKDITSPVTLGVITGPFGYQRKWKVKVVQLGPNHPDLAPPGVLQYYTGTQGKIMSFNSMGGEMLNNLAYGIGFKPQKGFCSVSLTGPLSMGVQGQPCTGDALETIGAKICGVTNSANIMLNSTTYPLIVKSDGENAIGNSGFNLAYTMLPCAG